MYNFKDNESLYATIVDTVTPTTSTEGVVGQFYIDQSTDPASLYLCTKVETVDSTNTYTWKELSGGSQVSVDNVTIKTNASGQIQAEGLTNGTQTYTLDQLLDLLPTITYSSTETEGA